MDLDLGAIGEDERVWGRNKVSDCERGEEMRDWQKDFVERKRKFKSWKGSDEMKKVKRNKKKKKRLITAGKNMKREGKASDD